jgi:iron complex outermembrane receptor protein
MIPVHLLWLSAFVVAAAPAPVAAGQGLGTLVVEVRSDSRPVEQAEVRAGDQVAYTDAHGEAALRLPPGDVELIVQRFGFTAQTLRAAVRADATTTVTVELHAESVHEEAVIVTATRTGRRIEDEPLRVEVLGHEEIEEKTLMVPGEVAHLLNETSGLRVQVTAPSLGGANVRVQGLKGRYTQVLADGLPLYGGQTGTLGLLQIPPMDLGQVEVIKGVASALYGASALGGVINLVSRRPEEHERELLVNRTTRGGTDGVVWLSSPSKGKWSYTFLGGGHFQERTDIDRDGWADLAGYRRGLVRPRIFWDNEAGRSLFATIGVMAEEREGGTVPGATAPDGGTFPEELGTRRLDGGVIGRFLVGTRLVTVRASAVGQRHRHQFGEITERDRHQTWFAEAAVSGVKGEHAWVTGAALQRDLYRSRDVPGFDYVYTVPGVFAQDEYAPASWVTLSASGRLDAHSEFGSFFNPRVSVLLRPRRGWTARVSGGTGYFAPTPFTEETEAVGLSRVLAFRNIEAERARSASLDIAWSTVHVELNGTVFGSIIDEPVFPRASEARSGWVEIVNADAPTRTFGSELLARMRRGAFGLVVTYTFVHSTELEANRGARHEVPLTPRHTAGIVGTWESEERGRAGVEFFYTGRQRLDDNPYRSESAPYLFWGVLVERRLGRTSVFLNAENLSDVRQTRYDPLVRRRRGLDGRWTVDAWAPLEGRVINGGLRLSF